MQIPACAQDATDIFEQSTVVCPNGGDVNGYTTIEAMNSDMILELDKIRAGKPSEEPYIFVLCPDTDFDASAVALTPLLSGAVFSCGTMGDPSSACSFVGGANQVLIEDSASVPNYELQMVSFIGVTFTGFKNAAISGNAGSNTTVDLYRSNFEVREKDIFPLIL